MTKFPFSKVLDESDWLTFFDLPQNQEFVVDNLFSDNRSCTFVHKYEFIFIWYLDYQGSPICFRMDRSGGLSYESNLAEIFPISYMEYLL